VEIISLKLDEQMLKNIDSVLKKHNFSTRTEFIRDAIRSRLSRLEKDEIIAKLAALRGTFKSKTNLSDEEVRELVFKETAEKFGIKLD
jgi:metal-responsive CopG/Arc/MetJ family transcriptional regulator